MMAQRSRAGKRQFLVRWLDYTAEFDSWEDEVIVSRAIVSREDEVIVSRAIVSREDEVTLSGVGRQ